MTNSIELCKSLCYDMGSSKKNLEIMDATKFNLIGNMGVAFYHNAEKKTCEITYTIGGYRVGDGYVVLGVKEAL